MCSSGGCVQHNPPSARSALSKRYNLCFAVAAIGCEARSTSFHVASQYPHFCIRRLGRNCGLCSTTRKGTPRGTSGDERLEQPTDSDRAAKSKRQRSEKTQRWASPTQVERIDLAKRGEAQGGSGGHAAGHVPDCLFHPTPYILLWISSWAWRQAFQVENWGLLSSVK